MSSETKWFEFRQNNSGGYFNTAGDKGIGHVLFVEAVDADHANARAQTIGIEFGTGCSCCGARWNSVWGDEDGMPELRREWGGAVRALADSDERPTYLGEPHLIFVHPITGAFYEGIEVTALASARGEG